MASGTMMDLASNIQRRRFYWTLSMAWLAAIYATIGYVRVISDALKNVVPFKLVTSLIVVGSFLGVLTIVCQRGGIRRRSTWAMLLGMAGAYLYGISLIKYPDEKIHFIQYGVLAYLLVMALQCDFSKKVSFVGAFVLTALFGLGDEVIQHFLPNRYYDINDVILNAVSGLMGLALVFIFQREMSSRAAK